MNQYTKEHDVWVQSLSRNVVKIGVTAYALEALGNIVAVELPDNGAIVKQGRPIGTIESAKMVSDIYAPTDGEISQVNQQLLESPAILNQDNAIWFLEIKVQHPGKLESLLTFEQYSYWVKGELT
jgi:glycine cleavage system H protein